MQALFSLNVRVLLCLLMCAHSVHQCLNKDGVSIHLSISFQYRIKAPDLFWVATQFKDMDGYDTVLSKTGTVDSGGPL